MPSPPREKTTPMRLTVTASKGRDYPARHDDAVRGAMRLAVALISVTGTAALGLCGGSLFGPVPAWLAATAAAVFVVFSLGSLTGWYQTCRYVRIIPYFQRRVGDIDTFVNGHAVARHLKWLDELALRDGNLPLSHFGFADDLLGETLVWHSVNDGLATVDRLLSRLTDDPDLLADCEVLADDLRRIGHALERAQQQDIRFCLILLHTNATSGHEWSVRRGTAF